MIDRHGLAGTPVFLALLLGAVSVSADTATDSVPFTYTEGWAVVSAPPPPGPYRAVNLDPRIPGQDSIQILPVEKPPSDTTSGLPPVGIPAEALNNPPAAGIPARSQVQDRPAASLDPGQAADSRQVPGYFNRRVPAAPSFSYQGPSPYPVQQGYPGYRNRPSTGYYDAPARQPAQQVPPPPVYDAMMHNRQSQGGLNTQGTQ